MISQLIAFVFVLGSSIGLEAFHVWAHLKSKFESNPIVFARPKTISVPPNIDEFNALKRGYEEKKRSLITTQLKQLSLDRGIDRLLYEQHRYMMLLNRKIQIKLDAPIDSQGQQIKEEFLQQWPWYVRYFMSNKLSNLYARAVQKQMASISILLKSYSLKSELSELTFVSSPVPFDLKNWLRDVSQTKQVRVISVSGATGHATLIATDPESNIYRFFDPSRGIYRFGSEEEFVENAYKYLVYVIGLKISNGDQPTDSSLDLSPYLEHKVSQSPFQSNRINLFAVLDKVNLLLDEEEVVGEGICAAMVAQLALWLLEHPKAEKLDLEQIGFSQIYSEKYLQKTAEKYEKYGMTEKELIMRSYLLDLSSDNDKYFASLYFKLVVSFYGEESNPWNEFATFLEKLEEAKKTGKLVIDHNMERMLVLFKELFQQKYQEQTEENRTTLFTILGYLQWRWYDQKLPIVQGVVNYSDFLSFPVILN